MAGFSRRRYLFVAGSTLTALAIGVPGAAAQTGDRLDYERNGRDVDFDFEGLTFETDSDDVELQDGFVDFERTSSDEIELSVDSGSTSVDFETDGDDFELSVDAGGAQLDVERDDDEFEVNTDGSVDRFEAEDEDSVEFTAGDIDFEVNEDEVEISGDVTLEWDGEDFEYADSDISLEFDDDDLEYTSPDLTLEWNEDGRDFEARRR
ncbi:hypothetical protein [Halomarina litorea]|uniref:hypothetical protein n=1 Tax=Halomarina litorea TaxID=2961595 RepID=UPI0020C424E9|nr:hypothetical protein [Halomarina sp. BCD28]